MFLVNLFSFLIVSLACCDMLCDYIISDSLSQAPTNRSTETLNIINGFPSYLTLLLDLLIP